MAQLNEHPKTKHHARLRHSAESLIEDGVAPAAGGGTLSIDTLELLYNRASNPQSAADALKLLHELQTHQVELDLLYEQLQANEYETNEELLYYRSLFELAPIAYLILATDGQIIEGNEAAGALFGIAPESLAELSIKDILTPESRLALTTLFQGLGKPETEVACKAELAGYGPGNSSLNIKARLNAHGDSVMMVLACDNAPAET